MKIALDANLIDSKIKSGLYSYSYNLIKELAKLDNINFYTLLYTSILRGRDKFSCPKQPNFSKTIIRVPNNNSNISKFLADKVYLPSILNYKKINVLHKLAGNEVPKNKKTRNILTIHDLRTLRIKDDFFPRDIKVLKSNLKNVSAVITVSETTKKDIIELLNYPQEKIFITHLGIEAIFSRTVCTDETKIIRNKYNLPDKFFFALGMVPRKNIIRVIKAFSLFKYRSEFKLVLGGAGSNGPWVNEYKSLISDLKLEKDIQLIGNISEQDLPLFYSSCFCFLFASLYEGFGIPVLEAMACKRPVITSNSSSLPEIAGNAATFVNPYSEEDIANSMNKICENEELYKDLVVKGTEQIKKFSWEDTAKKTLEVYNLVHNV